MFRKVTASLTAAPLRTLQGVNNICRKLSDYNGGYAVNEVRLLGNVGGEVREHQLQSGFSVVKFNMATNMPYQASSPDGGMEKRIRTDWHEIRISRPSVKEYTIKNVNSGDQVFVMGRSQRNVFKDDEGKVTSSQQYVNAERVFLLRKKGGASAVAAGDLNEYSEDDDFENEEMEENTK